MQVSLSFILQLFLPAAAAPQIQQLLADMRDIYSRTRVCPYVKPARNTSLPIRPDPVKCNLALDPGMDSLLRMLFFSESIFF